MQAEMPRGKPGKSLIGLHRSPQAGVAKLADAQDLKSWDRKRSCGFDSRPRHQCADKSDDRFRMFDAFFPEPAPGPLGDSCQYHELPATGRRIVSPSLRVPIRLVDGCLFP